MCSPPKLAMSRPVIQAAGAISVMTPAIMKAAPMNGTIVTE